MEVNAAMTSGRRQRAARGRGPRVGTRLPFLYPRRDVRVRRRAPPRRHRSPVLQLLASPLVSPQATRTGSESDDSRRWMYPESPSVGWNSGDSGSGFSDWGAGPKVYDPRGSPGPVACPTGWAHGPWPDEDDASSGDGKATGGEDDEATGGEGGKATGGEATGGEETGGRDGDATGGDGDATGGGDGEETGGRDGDATGGGDGDATGGGDGDATGGGDDGPTTWRPPRAPTPRGHPLSESEEEVVIISSDDEQGADDGQQQGARGHWQEPVYLQWQTSTPVGDWWCHRKAFLVQWMDPFPPGTPDPHQGATRDGPPPAAAPTTAAEEAEEPRDPRLRKTATTAAMDVEPPVDAGCTVGRPPTSPWRTWSGVSGSGRIRNSNGRRCSGNSRCPSGRYNGRHRCNGRRRVQQAGSDGRRSSWRIGRTRSTRQSNASGAGRSAGGRSWCGQQGGATASNGSKGGSGS
nr:autotransporter adhesin BpaC-like [Drosophila takahashii]